MGIGRIKGVFHPAVGLITGGNVARCCFSEPKCYFWQGWGCRAGDSVLGSWGWASQPHRRARKVLPGSWQGLLRAAAPSLLPKGSCGRSRKQRLKSPAWGFSDSDQLYICCCLRLTPGSLRSSVYLCYTHALEKHSPFFGPREHLCSLHTGQFPVVQTSALRTGYHSTPPFKSTTGNTLFFTFLN